MSGQQIVDFLVRLFPSFGDMPSEARQQRTEALGRYVIQTWVAGPDGLRQRGIEVAGDVHEKLVPLAASAKQSAQGGLEFLAGLREQLTEDAAFAKVLTAYAQLYAKSLQAGRPAGESAPADPAPAEPALAEPALAEPSLAEPSLAEPSLEDSRADQGLDWAPGGEAISLEDSRADGGLDLPPDDGELGVATASDLGLAPRGTSARASTPSSGGGIVIESSGGDLGDLDFADDDAPRAPAPTASSSAVVVESSGADDGMGLLDLEQEPEQEASDQVEVPTMDELLYAAPPAAAPRPSEPTEVSTMTVRERKEGKKPRPKPKPPSDMLAAGRIPKDPAEKAIYYFERTGDASYLGTATRLLEAQMEQAPHDTAAAVAAAGIAKASLLEGDVAGASRYAKIAQSKDPANPLAAEILVRLGRGEAQQAEFRRHVAEARFWIGERNFERARPLVEVLKAKYGTVPHGYLLGAFMAKLAEDPDSFLSNLGGAWKRYPPRESGEVTLGETLDADVVDTLVDYGRAVFTQDDAEQLKKTIENVDQKDNLIAGALRMAVALAKVALTGGGLGEEQQRRLTFAVGRALVGLQYYDAALPWFGKAACLNPTQPELKGISSERANSGALRRAFDRPGIKAQLKSYRCLGSELLGRHLQQRLEAVLADREKYADQLRTQGSRLAEIARKDKRVKEEIDAAAGLAAICDPLAPVVAAEEELHAVARERALAMADAKSLSKSSGLFATLKGAASKVSSAARETKLKYKEAQATQKHRVAVKRMTDLIAGSLSRQTWEQPALREFVRRAAVSEAFADYLDSEEKRVKADLARLADAK